MVLYPARLLAISKLQTNIQSFQIPLGKISGHTNCKDVKCMSHLSLHFSIVAVESHNAKSKKKKKAILPSIIHFKEEVIHFSHDCAFVG